MAMEIAEVLIPEAIVTVTGTTTVSPTQTPVTVPRVVLIDWAFKWLCKEDKNKRTTSSKFFFI
jgi:hypothetical protein